MKRKTSPSQTLKYLSALALGMVIPVVKLLSSFSEYEQMFELDKLHFFESVGLGLITCGLLLQYWWNSSYELDMLTDYLEEEVTLRIKIKTYCVIIFLAIFFGILISFSHKILIYCMGIIIYSLLDVWGTWQLGKTIEPLIKKRSEKSNGEERKTIETIYDYFFKNPYVQRILTIMFVNWIAFTLALIARYEKSLSRTLEFSAYVIVGLNIIVSELIITKWRRKRNVNLRKLEGEE